jgi:outer membrane protein OmpA-like peptidoglycan-associated protein
MSNFSRRATLSNFTRGLPLVGLLALASSALAGDPLGVNAALKNIQANWPQAQFSIDVIGLTDNSALTDRSLQVEYEAASEGYLTYLRVSSHGEILAGSDAHAAETSGSLSLVIQPPLGHERAIFLFSDRPLIPLLDTGKPEAALGADRTHADSLVRQITQLQSQGLKLAARQVDYLVEAPAGQTQYTTRSVVRAIAASESSAGRSQPAPRFPTRIEFDFDSDRLTQASMRDLDVFGEAMVESLKDRKVTLEGHTDGIGTDRYNMNLSMRRSASALRYLVESFGLPAEQLKATGRGKADPIATNDTEAGRTQNRRVDFIFEKRAIADR